MTLFALLCTALYASDTDEYKELLKKYTEAGQLSQDEAESQALKHDSNAKDQADFNKKVRGIASTLSNTNSVVIKLKNKPITINVKRETSDKRRIRKVHP